MKKVDYYKAEATNQIAHLKNKIIDHFWAKEQFFIKDTEEYYMINRAIGDGIDSMIKALSVEFRISRQASEHLGCDVDNYVYNIMARMLAEELIKSEFIPVSTIDPFYGDILYRVNIPVIGFVDDTKTSRGE
jgi:hypothetical protein